MATKHTSDCLQKAKDDEPIFVLRAQDVFAPCVIGYWANIAEANGTPPDKIASARKCADDMVRYQEHFRKIPD